METNTETPMNRRKHPRWRISPSYPCRILSDKASHAGRLLDLSAAGALIETEKAPEVGTRLSIQLSWLDSELAAKSSRLEGTVRRRSEIAPAGSRGFGIQFESESPGALAEIEDAILVPARRPGASS